MKKLKVMLNIDGKKRKYVAPRTISGAVFKKTLDLEKDFEKIAEPSVLFSKCYPLICEIFGNQFTVEQLESGLDVREVMPLANESVDHVISRMQLEKGGIPAGNRGEVLSFERYFAKRKRSLS